MRIKECLVLFIAFIGLTEKVYGEEGQCASAKCVQIGKNSGIVNIAGGTFSLEVNKGIVNFVRDPSDNKSISELKGRIAVLEVKTNEYLKKIQLQRSRFLNDKEILQSAIKFVARLQDQVKLLDHQISVQNHYQILDKHIHRAKTLYDVPLLKKLLKTKLKMESNDTALISFELAGLQFLDMEFDKSLKNYKRAIYFGKESELLLTEAGLQAIVNNQNHVALDYLEQALHIHSSSSNEFDTNNNLRYLGTVWHELGDYTKAKSYFTRSFEVPLVSGFSHAPDGEHAQLLFAIDPILAGERYQRGLYFYYAGQYEKAVAFYNQLLAHCAEMKICPEYYIAGVYKNLGLSFLALKIFHDAEASFQQAYEYFNNHLSIAHNSTVNTLLLLFNVQEIQNNKIRFVITS